MIRNATRAEVEVLIGWAAREGWNPGRGDLDAFLAADPEGFWVMEDQGELVAGVSLAHHDHDYAFLGFYIVAPEYRGHGHGYRLWSQVVATSVATTIGLDGVVAQQDNYRKSGFAYAHANTRFGGVLDFEPVTDLRILPACDVAFAALSTYDQHHNPGPRPRFLSAWIEESEHRMSRVFVEDGQIKGFGAIRACDTGYKIGPLFADTPEIADRLFRTLVACTNGGHVYLDIPMPNAQARDLTQRYGLDPVFETARMYRGNYPELPLANIFGITTFELG